MLLYTQILLPISRRVFSLACELHFSPFSSRFISSFFVNKSDFHSFNFVGYTQAVSSLRLFPLLICRKQASYKCRKQPFHTESSEAKDQEKLKLESEKERLKQIQEYFNQYIDEYYEIDESEEEPEKIQETENAVVTVDERESKQIVEEICVDDIIEVLREAKAADIVCIEVPLSEGPHRYVVICSPHNYKHANSLLQAIRKRWKRSTNMPRDQFPPLVKYHGGWHNFDINNMAVHVMTPEMREKYDLETVWVIGRSGQLDLEDIADDDDSVPSPKDDIA